MQIVCWQLFAITQKHELFALFFPLTCQMQFFTVGKGQGEASEGFGTWHKRGRLPVGKAREHGTEKFKAGGFAGSVIAKENHQARGKVS